MTVNSTKARPSRPKKPNRKFPMFAHPSGQWAKKIKRRLVYFGSWRVDPSGKAALETFEREWPFLREGKEPPAVDVSGGCTLKQLVNDFLASKEAKLNAGELSPRSFRDYFKTCEGLIDQWGRKRLVADLRPADFRDFRSKLADRFGKVRLRNEINRCCSVFNHAREADLIDKPVSYGGCFDRPSALALRRERNAAGPKLFTRDEILSILGEVDSQWRAMVLLALNGGLGNSDLAGLKESHFKGEWLEYPRPKTEIHRRIPLWKETMDALAAWLPERPQPKDEAKGLVFLTCKGRPWVRVQEKKDRDETEENEGPDVAIPIDALSQAFRKVLKALKINGRRGLGFYTLRHCFETYAGESRDQVAVDSIMGHVDSSMSANYRHKISDERLRAVVDVVHDWLWPTEKDGGEQ